SLALMAAIVAGLLIIRYQVLRTPAAELMRMAGLPRALDPVLVPILSPRPEYAAPFALASPVFAGQWWWAIFIMAVWGCSACGEELVFRGVLLPATRRAFGRWRGVMNGLLFALYHVHRPWAIPFRAIEAIAIVRPAVAFSSTVMAIAIRGAEGIVVLALVLMAVLTPPFRTLSTPLELPTVTWHPAPARLGRGAIRELPPRNNAGGVDVRGCDLSAMDLRAASDALGRAWFDDRTIWPGPDQMPPDFDPARILETGKAPGLGVRRLHEQGITGLGIGIGVVDRPLLTGHEEYRSQLDWYEEIDAGASDRAQMHGAAVASLAVGRTVGVAPDARLFYVGISEAGALRDLANRARGVRRLLEISRRLPEGRKIQVVAMSMGWDAFMPGYDDIEAAVRQARADGIFFVSSNLEQVYGFRFHGLGRGVLADPDQTESYGPGLFWADDFDRAWAGSDERAGQAQMFFRDRLLVPMDARTAASPTGNREYVFYRAGGWSWSIPYIAGVYALAAQVNPVLTPERFWSAALSTGRTMVLVRNGAEIPFGLIIDPPGLIAALGR
ncbi:MAG: CPBP family intramembrane metalloprotease, partial [Acidobacteria bacterium]|nr:CPBP family intramembrane metalloprotease [Acidobacteriota bacterium]